MNQLFDETKNQICFKHSGRIGDIIYSLPFVKKFCEINKSKAHLYIPSDTPSHLGDDVYHPAEEVMVDIKMFNFIKPLLEKQEYIELLSYLPRKNLPNNYIDLDIFRTAKINHQAGSIQTWFRKIFGISYDISNPWLEVESNSEKNIEINNGLVVSKSTRFCNNKINYEFLDHIDNIFFIGLEYEFDEFTTKNKLKNIKYLKVENALSLAQILKSSSFFIGNQSFNFAVAEGLKIKRALEVYEPIPNVIPVGGECIEFLNTKQIAEMTSNLTNTYFKIPPDRDEGYQISILRNKNVHKYEFLKKFFKRK